MAKRPQAGAQKPPEPTFVSVGKKLRSAFEWFEKAAKKKMDAEVKKRREAESQLGPKLTPEEVTALVDRQEELQKEVNPKLEEIEKISGQLRAHWGHTGATELLGTTGKTLISTSFSLSVNQDEIKKHVHESRWRAITQRMIVAKKMLESAMVDPAFRSMIPNTLSAQLKVTVTPPSSRRPRSGQRFDLEDDDE